MGNFEFLGLSGGRSPRGPSVLALALGVLSSLGSGCGSDHHDDGQAEGGSGGDSGTGGSSGVTTSTPIPEADFATRYAGAICDNMGACCARAGYDEPKAGCLATVANDVAEYFATYRTSLTYNSAEAGRCVAQLDAALKACDPHPEEKATACDRAYTGTVLLGHACKANAECQAPTGGKVACVGGTCSLLPPPDELGKQGDTCAPFQYPCEAGLYCDFTGRCSPALTEGEPCFDGSTPCAPGLFCDPEQSVCTASATEGSCLSGVTCDDRTHFCDGCTVTCEPKLADGAACQDASDCKSGVCHPNGCGKPLFGDFCGEAHTPKADTRMCPTDSEPTDDFAWDPLVGVGPVQKVWGSGEGDVFAITRDYQLFHYAGDSVWQQLLVKDVYSIYDVWGTSDTDTYLATGSGLLHGTFPGPWSLVTVFDPSVIPYAITGSADGTLYVGGYRGSTPFVASSVDGETWVDLGYSQSLGPVRSLAVSSIDDLFAISNDNSLLRRRDRQWEHIYDANSVAAPGADIYITSSLGLIKFDSEGVGTVIQFVVRPGVAPSSVWAYDEQTVFVTVSGAVHAPGLMGALFVGDGNGDWSKLGVFSNPTTVWAPSADELYVGTDRGVVRGQRR